MDDAGIGRLPHLLAEQRERVRLRLAGVDDDRQPRLLRRVDMATKTVLLSRPVALVVIIVEPGLADADDAWMRGAFHQLAGVDGGVLIGVVRVDADAGPDIGVRSEEHTSELQSLMRISYAVFWLTKKN